MASRIEGLDAVLARLEAFPGHMQTGVDRRIGVEVEKARQEIADTVPVRTGAARAAILSPDAIKRVRSQGGRMAWQLSLAGSKDMARKTFKLFWIEFGTKGYTAGDKRRAGTSKRGRVKFRKVARNVPARRAQPFFRPAVGMLIARMRNVRAMSAIVAAAAAAAGWPQDRVRGK